MGPITDVFRVKTEEAFTRIDGLSAAEVEDIVRDFIESVIYDYCLKDEMTIVDVILAGSRCRGKETLDSDIDVVVELDSDWNEDALFDLFHEEELFIGDVSVDINPITAAKTGNLEEYLPCVEEYLHNK